MNFDDQKIKDILISGAYVNSADIEKAEIYAKEHRISFLESLFAEEIITKELLGQAIAESFGIPYFDVSAHKPERELILRIPETSARELGVAVVADTPQGLTIATGNPSIPNLYARLEEILFPKNIEIESKKSFFSFFKKKNVVISPEILSVPVRPISLVYVLPEDIQNLFSAYKKGLETRFAAIIAGGGGFAPEVLDEIFQDAFAYQTSDIHFEPTEHDVLVRFRVDGVLHEIVRINKEYYQDILNRLKVMANLRIDEHMQAQDGAIRYSYNNSPIDFRLSIVPVVDGEGAVLRVLSEYVENFSFATLGLNPNDEKIVEAASRKPFGMILVVGPTGSGKTTTLYSILKMLNSPEVSIMTIEDPVEYKMIGINQIQVNSETNLTFAQGLRSIARQDPDIILVGEIRDNETADIAVNAALTGHLLLSTFHANDAATGIPRLLEMDVEPFLLSSTLEIIIAQRLVRKICENCRYSGQVSVKQLNQVLSHPENYFSGENVTLYEGKGCGECADTGYKGRTAIFEIIKITDHMKELIMKHPSTEQVWNLARTEGTTPLFLHGIDKVKEGVTTLTELLRVVTPPDTITYGE